MRSKITNNYFLSKKQFYNHSTFCLHSVLSENKQDLTI